MDDPNASPPVPKLKLLAQRFRGIFRSDGDVYKKRIQRRMKLVDLITRRLTLIKVTLLLVGYLWMVIIPVPYLGRTTYIDENALQPGQVNTQWNWGDVHVADRHLAELEQIIAANYTSEQRAAWLSGEFAKLGISTSTQRYSYSTSTSNAHGTNAYAIISSPRNSGAEAMVISASWLSRIDDGQGAVNIRGVSTILALAGFLKRFSYWGKDIVLVISDGYLEGMQAWLGEYHGVSQSGLTAEPLKLSSGVIWTALNIDYPGHSFSHLGIFFEGLNGRLPNQDLINSVDRIARYSAHVPVILYDHLDPREDSAANDVFSWMPRILYDIPDVKAYLYQARNVIRNVKYQYNGRGSGVHGLFHQFRIDAITLFAVPATGPHGFHAIGSIVESTLRTMNNLLERLHASFFFYILTGPQMFLKIGLFLPSAILISVAMMFHGLSTWVDAAWIEDRTTDTAPEKNASSAVLPTKWKQRRRPVIDALKIMAVTHIAGLVLFKIISSSLFANNQKIIASLLFFAFSFFHLLIPVIWVPPFATDNIAPASLILKAFNLCFASTVISIITVLNFSLAAFLTLPLGLPLIRSSPTSPSSRVRLFQFFLYVFLGLGWLLFAQQETMTAMWNWEVLGVWFAPFICIVYTPLLLQTGISCLL